MKVNLRPLQKYRRYSEDFKKHLVCEFESGKYSVLQLELLYGVSDASIYRWIYQYSRFNKEGYQVVEMKQSSSLKLKELQSKINELEAALGRKQIQIDYLETMMEVAKDELGIDIKKNYATPPSKGSVTKK